METKIEELSKRFKTSVSVQEESKIVPKPEILEVKLDDISEFNNNLWIQIPEEELHTSINTLIMDYLTTEGFLGAAEKLEESGVLHNTGSNQLIKRITIVDAIVNGRTHDALEAINFAYPHLLENDQYLHFHLQQLHLIELIRKDKLEEALEFAQNHLIRAVEQNPFIMNELERTMALFAFNDPVHSPFGDLMQPQYRQNIANEANTAMLNQN